MGEGRKTQGGNISIAPLASFSKKNRSGSRLDLKHSVGRRRRSGIRERAFSRETVAINHVFAAARGAELNDDDERPPPRRVTVSPVVLITRRQRRHRRAGEPMGSARRRVGNTARTRAKSAFVLLSRSPRRRPSTLSRFRNGLRYRRPREITI